MDVCCVGLTGEEYIGESTLWMCVVLEELPCNCVRLTGQEYIGESTLWMCVVLV